MIAAVAAGQLNSARQQQADKGLFHPDGSSWTRSTSAFCLLDGRGRTPRSSMLLLASPARRPHLPALQDPHSALQDPLKAQITLPHRCVFLLCVPGRDEEEG